MHGYLYEQIIIFFFCPADSGDYVTARQGILSICKLLLRPFPHTMLNN